MNQSTISLNSFGFFFPQTFDFTYIPMYILTHAWTNVLERIHPMLQGQKLAPASKFECTWYFFVIRLCRRRMRPIVCACPRRWSFSWMFDSPSGKCLALFSSYFLLILFHECSWPSNYCKWVENGQRSETGCLLNATQKPKENWGLGSSSYFEPPVLLCSSYNSIRNTWCDIANGWAWVTCANKNGEMRCFAMASNMFLEYGKRSKMERLLTFFVV